jgi:hypothetical protein
MVFGKEPVGIRDNASLRTLIVLIPNILFMALAYFSERLQEKKNG